MTELEEALAVLADENRRLQKENDKLTLHTDTLTKENCRLKVRLEVMPDEASSADVVTREMSDANTESAVLGTLQQREPARTVFQLTMQCLVFMMALRYRELILEYW